MKIQKKNTSCKSFFDRLGVKTHWPLLIVFLLIIVFYWPVLTLQALPYSGDLQGSDLTDINYPLRFIAHESLLAGEIPFWSDLISNGYPVLAESEAAFFYPPNVFFSLVSPSFLAAFNWSLVFHLLLAAFFFYSLARVFKIEPLPAALGAFIFVFSSFFVVRLKYTNMVMSMAWLPLQFWLLEKFVQERKFFFLWWLSPIIALQILTGHAQIPYYALFGLATYLMIRLFNFTSESWKKWKVFIIKALGVFLLTAILGAAIAALQVLPALELSEYSWREGGLTFEESTMSPYHPRNFVTWLMPYFFGNPAEVTYLYDFRETIDRIGLFWEVVTYIGVLPFLVSIMGATYLVRKRKSWGIGLLGVILVGVFLGLGKYSPIYELAWEYLPGMSFFRVPSRFFLLTIFALSVTAAYGFGYLFNKIKSKFQSKNFYKFTLIIIIVLVVGDLFIFARRYNTNINADNWLREPRSVEFLNQDTAPFKIYGYGGEFSWGHIWQQSGGWLGDFSLFLNHREIIEPNFNVLWDVASIDDLTSQKLKKNLRLERIARQVWIKPDEARINFPRDRRVEFRDEFVNVLRVQGVRYILTFFKLESPALSLVQRINFPGNMLPLDIYEIENPLPLAYWAEEIERVSTDESLISDVKYIEKLAVADFSASNFALLEIPDEVEELDYGPGQVKIVDWRAVEKIFDVQAMGPGFIIISNSFYPGWQAWVDGQRENKRKKQLRADGKLSSS